MWTVIIILFIAIIVTIILNGNEFTNELISTISTIFLFSIIGFVTACVIPSNTKTILKETYYLEKLQDYNNINNDNDFFLGIGNVNEKKMYSFYYKNGENYKLVQIPTKFSNIRYIKEREIPKVIFKTQVETDHFINHFSIYINKGRENSYTIFVPKGSIKNNY